LRDKIVIKDKKALVSNLQELNLIRLIPNMTTIAALCMGLTAIRFGILGQFEYAVLSIIAAAFFDGIDGRLARLLKVTSELGAEMDSLSDFISFGVSPAIVIYLATMSQLRNIGWGIVLFFAVCMAFRLARFNVMNLGNRGDVDTEMSQEFKDKFMGVPAPAGAMISLLPLILYFAFDMPMALNPYFYGGVLLITGLMLVSRIPTPSFKSMTFPRRWTLLILLITAGLIVSLIIDHWITLSGVILIYIGTIIYQVCVRQKVST